MSRGRASYGVGAELHLGVGRRFILVRGGASYWLGAGVRLWGHLFVLRSLRLLQFRESCLRCCVSQSQPHCRPKQSLFVELRRIKVTYRFSLKET